MSRGEEQKEEIVCVLLIGRGGSLLRFAGLKKGAKSLVFIAKEQSRQQFFRPAFFSSSSSSTSSFPAAAAVADQSVSACAVAAAAPAVQICVFPCSSSLQQRFQQPAAAYQPAAAAFQPAQQQRFPAAAVGDSDQQ